MENKDEPNIRKDAKNFSPFLKKILEKVIKKVCTSMS